MDWLPPEAMVLLGVVAACAIAAAIAVVAMAFEARRVARAVEQLVDLLTLVRRT